MFDSFKRVFGRHGHMVGRRWKKGEYGKGVSDIRDAFVLSTMYVFVFGEGRILRYRPGIDCLDVLYSEK